MIATTIGHSVFQADDAVETGWGARRKEENLCVVQKRRLLSHEVAQLLQKMGSKKAPRRVNCDFLDERRKVGKMILLAIGSD